MKKLIFAIFAIMLVFLCSCSSYSQGGYEFDPGETLSQEALESIFSESRPEETTMTVDENTVVYWTEGGSKYHLFADCSHLASSKKVDSGKIADAEQIGKGSCCQSCESRAGIAPDNE